MKLCLRTLVLLIRRLWDVFTVKRRTSAPLFDLHGHVSVQILTHDSMSVCSFEHNFPLLRLMRRTISGLCNLRTLLTIQLLTYKDVSVCKLSHRRTCLCAPCHTMSYVLSRPPCFHAVCRLGDVFMCVFAHKKDVCLLTFRIRETWVCVTFNTWHNVSLNFPMFYDNRRVSTRISRLYVMFIHKLTH